MLQKILSLFKVVESENLWSFINFEFLLQPLHKGIIKIPQNTRQSSKKRNGMRRQTANSSDKNHEWGDRSSNQMTTKIYHIQQLMSIFATGNFLNSVVSSKHTTLFDLEPKTPSKVDIPAMFGGLMKDEQTTYKYIIQNSPITKFKEQT